MIMRGLQLGNRFRARDLPTAFDRWVKFIVTYITVSTI